MVLITGATGNVGREVVNLILAEGRRVVAVTRNPATALLPERACVMAGDLAGAAKEFVTLAASAGVRRAVVLSALTVQYGGGLRRFADEFQAIEDAVKH